MSRKPRLFLDMDGTLSEWKTNLEVYVEKYEDAKTAIYEVLRRDGYFYNLEPHRNVVDAVKELIHTGEIEIYVMSCYITNSPAFKDKNRWLDTWLPEIDHAHRIFVPDGEPKPLYVSGKATEEDYLLDDYSKNCIDWDKTGTGIKFYNGINGTRGTWEGNCISINQSANEIVDKLKSIILHREMVCDIRPQEEEEYDR